MVRKVILFILTFTLSLSRLITQFVSQVDTIFYVGSFILEFFRSNKNIIHVHFGEILYLEKNGFSLRKYQHQFSRNFKENAVLINSSSWLQGILDVEHDLYITHNEMLESVCEILVVNKKSSVLSHV